MCHKISGGNSKRVKSPEQFFLTVNQAHKMLARLAPTVKNHTPRCAESTDLARIDKLQVLMNRHENQRFSRSEIKKRQINPSDRHLLPACLYELDIGTKDVCTALRH